MRKISFMILDGEIENLKEKVEAYQNKGYEISLQKVQNSFVMVGEIKIISSFLSQFYNPYKLTMVAMEYGLKEAMNKPFSRVKSYEEPKK